MLFKTIFFSVSLVSIHSLSCKDMKGNDVPWFIILKPPSLLTETKGQDFFYLDPNNKNTKTQPSSINSPGSLSYTLSQINNLTISSFLFNDQPPAVVKLSASVAGHAKGVVMYNSNQAVYISHSIPLYPSFKLDGNINTTIDYSQTTYGQDIMCVSLSTQSLFSILGVMALVQPLVYYKNIIINNLNVTKVISNVLPDVPPSFGMSFYENGYKYHYIAKSRYSNLFLWDNSVPAYLKTGLEVESWGRPYMPSSCPPNIPYAVLNIQDLKIGNFTWKNTQDHSKWAIATGRNVTCYGDMNRMTSQLNRGGGTICIELDWLHKVNREMIVSVVPCGFKK